MSENLTNDSNTCVVCFKNVLYYSIGECDHPVCFECSTRMRVLCQQNECPICRQDLSRVVFTDTILPYKELRNKTFTDRLFERQYKIGFGNEDIKGAYDKLLENRCKICDNLPPFRTFAMLNDHTRKVHERYYCELCVKHLKIFTNERRCYTRQELAHHRRKGDLDDTSHRGHPLCEFCEERFMDADELYRHLRKEHLYCHLCDADGKNLYYASHNALAQHFRTDHYLCEEGECAGQHLTAVFRSEIDLKAHKATVHGRGLARGAARQARTLELQFNITPHLGVGVQHRHTNRDRSPEEDSAAGGAGGVAAATASAHIDTRSDEHFPRLSAAPPSAANLILAPSSRTYKGSEGLARTDRNFPALGVGDGASPASAPSPSPSPRAAPPVAAALLRNNSKPSVSIQLHSKPASASNFRLTQTSSARISIPQRKTHAPLDEDDFPSLSVPKDDHPSIGAGTVQPAKVTLINSQEMSALKNNNTNCQPKKPPLSADAFPALSATTAPAAPPQWITVSKPREKIKPPKSEPPPKPKQPTFNATQDFPTLPANVNKTKTKSITPVPQVLKPSPSQNDNVKLNKKEKKKQINNTKKEISSELSYDYDINDKHLKESYNIAASVNNNNNTTAADKKIKTVESSSTVTINSEKSRNGGNGDFALAAKDYPPLNPKSSSAPLSKSTVSNKNSASSKSSLAPKKASNGSVPPGFKSRPACDGMTFTNSAGQTFPAPPHAYIPPPDFESRNRALVKKFATALGGSDAFENFKVASRAFRDNILNAEEFYQHCQTALGSRVDEVFPELVALLPDIAKQQELMVGRGSSARGLAVCSTCGQMLAPQDVAAHDSAHWPPLASR